MTILSPRSTADMDALNSKLETRSPQEIVAWAVDEFGDGLTLACSFGGVSGMALLDMAVAVKPDISVFYLDTGFLFPETLQTRDRAVERYGIRPVGYSTQVSPEEQARRHGEELWARDPDLCCAIRKVEPNARALKGKAAWITGLRRDQSSTRRAVRPVDWDAKFGLYKVSPLAGWTERQVWAYVIEHGVPYNPLHDAGYPSIGCTHCTRPVGAGEDIRSGRWSGTGKIECGLHK